MLTEYFIYIPYFLGFVAFGIATNYAFIPQTEKITKKTIAREILGSLWVSFLVFAVFDQFFNFNNLFVYAICSVAGFLNSRLINFLNKDFIEFVFGESKKAVSNLVSNLKRDDSSSYGGWHTPWRQSSQEISEEEKSHEIID